MRILHLIPHTEAVDGIQRVVLDLSRELRRLGHVSAVAALFVGDNLAAWQETGEVLLVDSSLAFVPRRVGTMLEAIRRIHTLPTDFDLVVAHRVDLVNAGAVLSRRSRAPLVLAAHNAPPEWLRWGDRLRVPGTRRVSAVLVGSRFMATMWGTVVEGIPVRVLPLPVDTKHFEFAGKGERLERRERHGLRPETAILGFVGRLEEIKGLQVLAAAADQLHREGRDVHVLIQGGAGKGVSVARTRAYRNRCEASLGDCPSTWWPAGPDVREVFALATVAVVPSVWSEPSGLVVSEALAMGTPVVASDIGGIPEQLPDHPLARSVTPDSPEALAAGVRSVLDSATTDAARQRLRDHVTSRRSGGIVATASWAEMMAQLASHAPLDARDATSC
jgi:glycosyltransferase involved in cell wall biosynthesis